MDTNWVRIYNRLFDLINIPNDPAYFSGGRFIKKIREIEPFFPDYNQYISERRSKGKSTSRKDYFYDILLSFNEASRLKIIHSILEEIEQFHPEQVAELKEELGGKISVPTVILNNDIWNADRLNSYLQEIDIRISSSNYEGAITLAYTCLEGFLKAFIKNNIPDFRGSLEIVALSKAVQKHLKQNLKNYPDESLTMLNHIAHTVDRTRNSFSESHFDKKAERWLAQFIRDLVNTEIRLLLHFMNNST